jgi:hypothetical protein
LDLPQGISYDNYRIWRDVQKKLQGSPATSTPVSLSVTVVSSAPSSAIVTSSASFTAPLAAVSTRPSGTASRSGRHRTGGSRNYMSFSDPKFDELQSS